MDHRQQRNEFGLDKLNEQDVRNEASSGIAPWVVAGLAAFAFFAFLAFYTTKPTDLLSTASNPPPVATTTGSATR